MYRRRGKYNARKVQIDGITFDRLKEANRYSELKLLEKAGLIKDLTLQPRFNLQESFKKNGKSIGKIDYIADFMYFDNEKKKTIVEDVKGYKTDVYKLKKKLFERKYMNLEIKEI